MKTSTRQLTLTALLLALILGVQQFRLISQFITGPLVNAILIMAALLAGLAGGLSIAALSPVLAFLIAPSPVHQAVPQMIPLVVLGNAALVLCVWLGKKYWPKAWPAGVAAGALLKPLVLFLGVRFVILPFFAAGQPERIIGALNTMFSSNQFITAAIGGALACIVYRALPKKLREPLRTV